MVDVCLVSPSHLAANPRVVKEASACAAAGLKVHVVHGSYVPTLAQLDTEILRRAAWTGTSVAWSTGPAALSRRVVRKIARALVASAPSVFLRSLADAAHHISIAPLAATAVRIRARLYIGHCTAGLVAAARASAGNRASLGFDAEDFHRAETNTALHDSSEQRVIPFLEARDLTRCSHLTASSPLIAEEYRKVLGLEMTPILNVFPISEGPAAPVNPSARGPRRIYWFSQTIGPGRGLEEILAAIGRMRTTCRLELRGACDPAYRLRLDSIAKREGVAEGIVFLPFAPPDEMVTLGAAYDLGLAIESRDPPNRDLALTNKAFTYLLAGVPVLLTPTQAQTWLAGECGEAALLVDLSDPSRAAAELDRYFADPDRVCRARAAAWTLGRGRFNWDREGSRLAMAVASALEAAG